MMNNSFNITCRVVVPLCIAIALLPDKCDAAHIYNLVDYPDLQNGHTVTGTITTTDDAPDDGLLDIAEVLDWEWEVSDGLEVTIGEMHPIEPDSISFTEVLGIGIDSQGIYFPHELGNRFKLEIGTNLNSRGSNLRRLAWLNGNASPLSVYVFNGVTEGDIGFRAWGTDLPANPNRWLIAERVPEPSGLALSCCVAAFAAAMLRRQKK